MTPRPPLRLTRPLATTIAPPGSLVPAARRRGATLSWRRAGRIAATPSTRNDVHHHWPLNLNLLFRPMGAAQAMPSRAAPAVAGGAKQAPTSGMAMIWERHGAARISASMAPARREDAGPQTKTRPPLLALTRARWAAPHEPPIFARTLHNLVEQRWLRAHKTWHLPVEHRTAQRGPSPSADRDRPTARRSSAPDAVSAWPPMPGRVARSFSRPMRPGDRPLFTGDPVVHRSLRRIAVTPLAHRRAETAPIRAGSHAMSRIRDAADIASVRPAHIVRARPAEQHWAAPRMAASASSAQPFAPIFSKPGMSTPAIAIAPGPVAAPSAPALPDVNRLVDEVMRRIERQTRQDRLRRGM